MPTSSQAKSRTTHERKSLPKTPTGVQGLDEITGGGLPTGRTTLVCGAAGSGKTMLALEFLVHGIREYQEPAVFMAFEETAEELRQNVASMGFDLKQMEAAGKLVIDPVYIERSEIEETGEYDLEPLFIRLGNAIDSVKAKRVVLDTIEVLFAGLRNESIIRAELRRLFRWLKKKGVTAIVTGERGEHGFTRYGLEEYVADCVILLDHRVTEQISTRRLRIMKYRGTLHGTDEYPFLMSTDGISVVPITSLGLTHSALRDRVASGVPGLDAMLSGGKGFFRGSSILISGTAGTGKSSLAATFVNAACKRGERCLYFSFEESIDQVIRNMESIGLHLQPWVDKRLLQFEATRPSSLGLEAHLAAIHHSINESQPDVVVVDPISSLMVSDSLGVRSMLIRLVDFLKVQHITAVFTHLSTAGTSYALEATHEGISSLMDTWLLLRDMESDGHRSYGIYVLKSRGMPHSHEIKQFRLTDNGIQIGDVITRSVAQTAAD
jgi:circadian clock protein KaiC